MAEIFTKKGERILVDDEDFGNLNAFRWHVSNYGYARCNEPTGLAKPRYRLVSLHRQLVGLAFGDVRQVDHINGDRLDNRKANLRICTHAENGRNRGAPRNNTSGFKGVHFHKQCRKWQAQIKIDGQKKHLGLFDSAEEAHAAYCLAADLLHGTFARYGRA